MDLESIMKASQAISGQIVLDELLKKLMEIVIENAGAQRGCLILEKDGKWVIEAEGPADLKDMTTLQAIKVEESDAVCPSIVRHVARSHENLVLDDAAQKGPFVDDPYVKRNQTKSVLCTPLLNRGRLSGILYLENNLAANTFTPERINVLELLAGQAAIALENARLYQQAQQEIAERKLAEAALRESEQRFRTIFNSVNDAIFVHDPATGDILDVNAKMCTMYGYTREEALQITVKDLSSGEPPYTQRDALAWMKKAATGEPQLFEWMARDKDGRLFWVEVNMRQAIGDQDRLLVVVRDITERKRVEEALEKRIVALTQPLDTTEGIAFEDLFNLSDIQHLQDLYAEAFGVAALITHPDGTPITQPSNFTELCSEIIRKTSKGVKNCNLSDATIGRHNPSGPTIRPCLSAGLCNAGASITVGGHHIANWLIGQVRNETQDEEEIMAYAREIGADETAFRAAYRQVPTMSQEQFERVAQVLFAVANQLSTSAYQNIQQARFIAERKRAEETLRENEERLRIVLEGTADGIWDWNPDTGQAYFSPRYYTMLGYEPGEFPPAYESWRQLLHPDDAETAEKVVWRALEEHTPFAVEFRLKAKNGEWRWILGRGKAAEVNEEGKAIRVAGSHTDITERKQTEAVLRESEARWRSLVNSAPAVIMTVDKDGRILTTNRTVSGKDVAQVVGTSLYDYLPPEDHGRVREAVQAVFRTGALQHYEIHGHVPSGDEFWFEAHVAAIQPADEVEAAILIAVDTTERKRVEIELAARHKAERRFSDRLTILATITNRLSKVRTLDELYRHSVEAGRERLGFDRISLWFVTQDHTTILGTYGTGADGQTTDERLSQHPINAISDSRAIMDGSDTLRIHRNVPLYQDGKQIGVGERLAVGLWDGETVIGFLEVDNLIHQQPFTDQDCELLRLYASALGHLFNLKRAQNELAQLAETLEQRVAERTAQLEAANKELEAFSYSVSHDLRAPLRIVDGYTRILEKDYAPLLDAEGERVCAVIHHQTQLMGELIDDLLALSRLSRTEMHMVPINMETLTRSVFDELAASEAQERLDFQVDPLPPAVGDPTMIRQVWTNLLSNAIKFSANREQAVIRVSGRQEARETVYSVRDNGAGFEMEYADKLFGVFQRLHSRREFEGTGVGLAIVQRVIHRHGGRVWAEGQVDQSATFYFALPQKGT